MKHQTLGQIAKYARAELHPAIEESRIVRAVSIDTRTLNEGDVYVPIIGERLDGHRFIDTAFDKGAIASFHDASHIPSHDDSRTYLAVDDTTEAFTRLAANYRASLDLHMIGITGSNGKTTTKDIIHSVMQQKFRTIKTTGNLNNAIGVPRTLLQINEDSEAAVVEMGMSGLGEISHLTRLVRPHIAIITNVGEAHLEQLGTRENIAKAKLEILEGLDADGIFLYNYDNEILRNAVAQRSIPQRVISFGTDPGADVTLVLERTTPVSTSFSVDGASFTVDLLGAYQMYNAAVAVIVGHLYGLDDTTIQKGLHITDQTKWRTELEHFEGFDILVDVYKSNPSSLEEALHTAGLLHGYHKKIAILGDMLELGPDEWELHRDVGRKIDPNVFDDVLFYGKLSKAMMEGAMENFDPSHLFHFDAKPDLVDKAKYLISHNSLVLVKGSRAMRLEEVVESLSGVTV